MEKPPVLYIVSPCYNEEAVLPSTASALLEKLTGLINKGRVSSLSRIFFVNDGSRDRTWELVKELHAKNPLFSGLSLSRNRGHQNALLAGLMYAKSHADITISLDADLQDDIDCIDAMLEKYGEGCEIVYGVRRKRDTDTWFKRVSAEGFYKFIKLLGADIVYNHADYRLMSARALEALEDFKEVNLFLRGLVPMLGFKTGMVYYDRRERTAGESKYPLKKMLFFALQGITSLTVKPLRMITELGLAVFLVAVCILLWSMSRYMMGETILGWTSVMVSLWAIGGLILFALGIIGEYLGKIYLESKHRPRYVIGEILDVEDRCSNSEQ